MTNNKARPQPAAGAGTTSKQDNASADDDRVVQLCEDLRQAGYQPQKLGSDWFVKCGCGNNAKVVRAGSPNFDNYGPGYCKHSEEIEAMVAGAFGNFESPATDDEATDSWQPIDLGPYLRGEIVRPEPTVGLSRSDGLRMLYPGKEHAVIGEMESGKSWFSLASTKAELDAGNHVLYLHFEEADPSDTVERLLALGAAPADIEKRFHFVAPQRMINGDLHRLLQDAPTLVIFDGVNEAMSLHGWGIREEDGAAKFRRHLVMPCIRTGAATLACDHVVKDRDKRNRNAIGSIHKGNGLSGSLVLLETAEPFGRGKRGRSHVFVTKDRPGHLRRHGRADKEAGKTFMGELVVDDEQDTLEVMFWAAREEGEPTSTEDANRTRVLSAVIALIDAGIEAKLLNIQAKAKMQRAATSQGLADLVISGVLAESKVGRATVYTLAAQEEGAQ